MIPIPIRKSLSSALVFLIFIACQVSPAGFPSLADTRPSEDRGAMALGQAIKRLGVVGSVLHTGAHPDDEDSGLLAYLARGRQVRTAYLSLTRGDGGQNVIGPELYEPLGVIRTDELLAARRLDGAQQFDGKFIGHVGQFEQNALALLERVRLGRDVPEQGEHRSRDGFHHRHPGGPRG